MDIQLRMCVIGGSYQHNHEAAISTRAHIFSANSIYSILWWFSLLANCFQEHPAAHISYGRVTSATSYDVCVFWCYQDISIANAAVNKQHYFLWKMAISNRVLYGMYLCSMETCFGCWVSSSIIYVHMAFSRYCSHYLNDKLVICAFIGLSFHQAIFLHTLWYAIMKVYLVSLELSVPSPIALKGEDQQLPLGGFLRGK